MALFRFFIGNTKVRRGHCANCAHAELTVDVDAPDEATARERLLAVSYQDHDARVDLNGVTLSSVRLGSDWALGTARCVKLDVATGDEAAHYRATV